MGASMELDLNPVLLLSNVPSDITTVIPTINSSLIIGNLYR